MPPRARTQGLNGRNTAGAGTTSHSRPATVPPSRTQEAVAPAEVHPNGRPLIAIRDVNRVYKLSKTPSLKAYRASSNGSFDVATLVTPHQVRLAIGQQMIQQTENRRVAEIEASGRTHPNGRILIRISEVRGVYDHDGWIPTVYYDMAGVHAQGKRGITRNSLVNAAQVEKAVEMYDEVDLEDPHTESDQEYTAEDIRELLYDIDTQWGSMPQGGAYKESEHYSTGSMKPRNMSYYELRCRDEEEWGRDDLYGDW